MEDGHLIHERRLTLCLLIRCLLLAHGQLPVKHGQMILAIRQRQLGSQRHIQSTTQVTLWQSLLWLQVIERCFREILSIEVIIALHTSFCNTRNLQNAL